MNATKTTTFKSLSTGQVHVAHIWNTGRQYTPAGQIVGAAYDDATGTVWFADISRGVYGFVDECETEPEDLRSFVMDHYDNMTYQNACYSEVKYLSGAIRNHN